MIKPEVFPYEKALNDLDYFVIDIINRLTKHGHTAYIVGGFIRDHVLDLNPKDIDLVSSASPSQIKKLFHIQIGTMKFLE